MNVNDWLRLQHPPPAPTSTSTCWLCHKPGATIKTEPEPPDYEAWWYHQECYWKMQSILYD